MLRLAAHYLRSVMQTPAVHNEHVRIPVRMGRRRLLPVLDSILLPNAQLGMGTAALKLGIVLIIVLQRIAVFQELV